MSALNKARHLHPEDSAVSTIKIIITLLVFIIGILFLGRFLF